MRDGRLHNSDGGSDGDSDGASFFFFFVYRFFPVQYIDFH